MSVNGGTSSLKLFVSFYIFKIAPIKKNLTGSSKEKDEVQLGIDYSH